MGVYLFGSAVQGGLPMNERSRHPRRARPPDDARRSPTPDRRPPRNGHAPSAPTPTAPRGHYRRRVEVHPWRYPPPLELQYGDWWRGELPAGEEPWTSPTPDLAMVLTSVRDPAWRSSALRPIRGARPGPSADLKQACRDVIPELLPGLEADDTRNAILTLARIWFTLATGRIESKDVAAAWALDRLPNGAGKALRRARAGTWARR